MKITNYDCIRNTILCSSELTLLDVCMLAKCFSNKLVALKVINDGGVYVNHKKLSNPHAILIFGIHILPNMITVLRIGRMKHTIFFIDK